MLDVQSVAEISKGVDEHLRKLEAFTTLLREIKASLDELRHAQERSYLHELRQVKSDFQDVLEQLKKHGLSVSGDYDKEFRELQREFASDAWPLSVDPEYVCDTPEKLARRTDALLTLVVGERLKDKRFLDYGCGQGHAVAEALRREAAVALGYDVDLSQLRCDPRHFTDQFDAVRASAPFDIVLLHDVLDHAVVADPLEILARVKGVLAPHGRVYVSNHPWSSRHGGHLYLAGPRANKAFAHLVFDPVELVRIGGYQSQHNVGVTTPLETYRHWFETAGFKVVSEIPIRDRVEELFLGPSRVHDRLKKHFAAPETMVNHLEISFVEYVLEPVGLLQQQLI